MQSFELLTHEVMWACWGEAEPGVLLYGPAGGWICAARNQGWNETRGTTAVSHTLSDRKHRLCNNLIILVLSISDEYRQLLLLDHLISVVCACLIRVSHGALRPEYELAVLTQTVLWIKHWISFPVEYSNPA